jgi:phosphatidylinositol alpha 1,6-mannosyltransferase
VRVAIVTESFLPQVNGVSNSVLRILEHLARTGNPAVVVAPGRGPETYAGAPVVRVPAVPLPVYRSFPVGLPTGRVAEVLAKFRPDVVHLASPIALGAAGASAARQLGVPAVAVFQSDVAGFAARYGLGFAGPTIWRLLRRVHHKADLTLAPSSATAWQLEHHGIRPVARWGRGVDLEQFNPGHRDLALRRHLAPRDEALIGYVGRLAPEKQVHRLGRLDGLPGSRLVVVGDGPSRRYLERRLPRTRFVGFRTGTDLARIVASLDVFVHCGAAETFGQAIQEALAAGVPVVAPAAGGPLDLVQHGVNGWLYPADDPDAIRPAVRTLVTSPLLRQRMGRAARAGVAGRSWPAVGDELLAHYRSVADRVPARPVAA